MKTYSRSRTKHLTWERVGTVCFLLFPLWLGCRPDPSEPGSDSPSTSQVELPTARIGYVPIAVALPLYVAYDNGYFTDAGVKVELVRISTSNELGTAGTLGRVDFMMPCALNVIFDIASASGVKHRLFGLNIYSDKEPHVADYLLVPEGSSLEGMSDLRGTRIAGHPGSATQTVIKLIMAKQSLSESDYTFIPLQPQEWGPALSSGSIDAVAALEPQASELLATGTARSIVDGFYAKLLPDLPLSGWWVSAKLLEKPDAQRTIDPVIAAYSRAVAYIEEYPEEAKAHFQSYAPISQAALSRMQLNRWSTPEDLNVEAVQEMADIFAEHGVLKERVQVRDFLLN